LPSYSEHTSFVASLTEDKSDPKLGHEVEDHLIKLGLVHPTKREVTHAHYNPKQAVHALEVGIHGALGHLGIDMDSNPSMKDTPRRYAHMLVGELTKGLNFDFFPKCTDFPNGEPVTDYEGTKPPNVGGVDEMILLRNIQTISLCEHHLQTIYGVTHIAYLPADKQIGISKLARVTDFFARRPQVQERMTEQIYAALAYVLGTEDVAVVQECAHYCMRARGALQHSSVMQTNKMGGKFKTNPALRQEFLDACPAPISQ
jgi:GTP cyclohydrolase I